MPGAIDPRTGKPAVDDGTIAAGVEPLPNWAPVTPTAAPLEQKQSWGDWLTSGWDKTGQAYDAGRELGRGDRSDFDTLKSSDGWEPIVAALGLPITDNPTGFAQSRLLNGIPGGATSSELLRRQGKGYLDSLVDQATQEEAIAAEIRARRAKDPKFLAGLPDTVPALHSYFLDQEKKRRAAAGDNLASAGSGAGVVAGQLAGSMVESLHDPLNLITLPIGGGGKTVLQIAARETLLNGALEALQLPFVAHNRKELGENLTATEAATDVATAGLAGGALEVAFHGAGKAIASMVGSPAVASSTAAKLFEAMPERLQKQFGPGAAANWGKRMAAGDDLGDVFSQLSNDELAGMTKTIVGADKLSPEERAAAGHLERSSEIAATSPYEADPKGAATHEEKLGQALKDAIDGTQRPEVQPIPKTEEAVTPASTVRPPAATSTAARRPLAAPSGPVKIPTDVYEGLKARGIPDHVARGAAAGVSAEALGGDPRALNPTSGAFGYGQWLGARKDELFRRYGPSPTREQQLDFLAWELKGGDAGGKQVLAARDEVEALDAYVRKFMRPAAGNETEGDLKRGLAALGRGGEAVEPSSGAGGSATVIGDDPEVARLREQALKLDDAVIGSSSSSAVPPMFARSFRPDDLTVDAARFQFKAGGDNAGVTERLRGVDKWNPMYAGRVVTWEDAGGRVFIADGHQRLGLAKRLESEGHPPIAIDALNLREADGVSADDARVYGALKNIAEGTGSMVDAAKVIRGAGDHLLAHLPPKSALVRDARALASLSDEAFGAVYNDVLPADFAAVIGHLLPDRPETHGAMVDLLVKLDPANRGQAESIVRQGIAAGMHKAEQVELFGTREVMSSLMLERAKVLEKVLANLRRSKLVFKTAAKEADTLEAVGSKIAKSASEKEAQANAQALEIVSRLAFTRGPVGDALNEAARKLAGGGKLGDVADEAARAIRGTDLGALAGTVAVDDASRLVPDGAGRGGDSAEAGAAVREEQPSLIDLERATERFSDPDGAAVKQQAESRLHDFKADLGGTTRRERIKAATAALEGGKPGELRTVEPFPEEPGYHRFRYVAKDGTAVGGNYTLDRGPPPILEGFNVGDTNSPTKLGAAEVRNLFAEIRRQHPEIERIHAFRMTGARAVTGDGPKEIWIDLAGKGEGMKPEDVEVRTGEPVEEPALDSGAQVDPAIADKQRQQTELKAAAPLQSVEDQLGTMGLSLFDHTDQPTFRLSDDGPEISAKDLLDELDADAKAIATLKGCL